MSFGVGEAAPDSLSLAVAFHQAPSRFPDLLHGHGPLPTGMAVLLRLAGGGSLNGEDIPVPPLVSQAELKDAARFFVQQVLLARDADHYRLLGVGADASIEQIKEHHRLLMRLFHPDRSEQASESDAATAARINLAYNALRLPADRAAYDAKLRQAPKVGVPLQPTVIRMAPLEREPVTHKLPPVVARHLPQFVLAGIAMIASLAVGIVYVSREPAGAIGSGDGGVERTRAREARLASHEVAPAPPLPEPVQPVHPPVPVEQLPGTDAAPPAITVAKAGSVADAPEQPVVLRPPMPETLPAQSERAAAARVSAPDVGPLAASSAHPIRSVSAGAAADTAKPAEAAQAPLKPPMKLTTVLPPQNPPPAVQEVVAAAPVITVVQPAPPPPAPQVVAAPAPQAAPAPAPQVAAAPAPQPVAAPATVPAPAPAPAPSSTAIAPGDLVALVTRLSELYQKGDLDAFLALFDNDARIERGGKERIRSDYGDLFRSTTARQLYIWDIKWTAAGGLYRGQGNYQAKVRRIGEDYARVYDGTIRLEVVQVNGVARLHGIFH